ncbi:glucuronate isomerase [Treponema primitia ZAS-2]|uniref:Uronate isomerase n=1 Tax=Treponema primitia (strain ATCC BAA-887 / DSM 12427 / ZAS-2) TaxID=545694 RepID=F5YKQ3_TREPZ|nr:glucuronate isomerase [Treponema primitia]AEF84914.1 glucuronate isomerase [Treponema primitia ZAS-2]
MKTIFMDGNFLLSTEISRKLYHEAAAGEPIFDYHCHLNPKEIAENRRFANLSEIWLAGDHYKWRVMRANGIDERLITGDADPYDKFLAWAETVPRLLGNPLYHWSHLELQRYFDIYEPLSKANAPQVWNAANEKLKNDEALSVYGIFRRFKVYAVGTTDDPADGLEWHDTISAAGKTETKVLPSFRPDRALNVEKPDFPEYINHLGKAAGKNITNIDDLLAVLRDRINFFDKHGCCAADHGLEYLPFETARDGSTGSQWEKEAGAVFAKALSGGTADRQEVESFKTFVLCFLAGEYHDHDWAMQLHLSALRTINTPMLKILGPDTGYDVVHDHPVAAKLSRLLDTVEERGKLPKVILYSLNPKDFYPLATVMGSFQGDGIPGKMQLGSAWWFLDHRDGMENQMRLLANTGLLSRFVGMLTDSRSFLSYPRHEYFRRILCNLIGGWAENGEVPDDFFLLGDMVRDISFRNALRYFENSNNSNKGVYYGKNN